MSDYKENNLSKEVPEGFCQCGCGQKTRLAPQTDRKRGWKKGEPIRYVNGHQWQGKANPSWNGGRTNKSGYSLLLLHDHNRADCYGYVSEHILIAEKAIGKSLPDKAVVHHVDKNRSNNNRNLVICEDNAYHQLLHQRQKAYEHCGNPKWRRCTYCKKWDDPQNMYTISSQAYHRQCARERRLLCNLAKITEEVPVIKPLRGFMFQGEVVE